MAAGTMQVAGVAMTAKAGSSLHTGGGGKYPIVLAVVSGALAFTGPGAWSADTAVGVLWAGADGAPTAATGVVAVAIALLAAVVPIGRMVRFDAAPSRAGADSNTPTVSRGRAHHRLLNLVATAQPGVRDVENEFLSPLGDVGRAAFTAGLAQVAAATVPGAHVDASGPVPARRSRYS
jgi:hypothetical protein